MHNRILLAGSPSEVNSTVNFAFNSTVLDADARATLMTAGHDWIRQFPEVRFKVYGHTDLVGSAKATTADVWILRRAQMLSVAYPGPHKVSTGHAVWKPSHRFGETQPADVVTPEVANVATVGR